MACHSNRERVKESSGLFDQPFEPVQGGIDLLARDPSDRPAGHTAEHSAGQVVLVAVGEACAAAVGLEPVDNARAGVNRSLTVPDDAPAGVVLHDLPVNVKATAGELQA